MEARGAFRYLLPGDFVEPAQPGDILEELTDQDGRRFPQRAGQELRLEQAFVPLLRADRLHPFQTRGLQVVPLISAKVIGARLVPQLLQANAV
ncbi:hypothetical protein HC749_14010 [Arthrobacter sp. S13_S34]|nr:hypothetical protein [Arthrobacter sp. S13_S34]